MKGPIALGTIRTSFVLGLRLLVQAGTLLLVARMLGPDQFGAFAGVAALAVLLGTLSTCGTHLVLLGEISKEPSRRDQVLPYAIPCTLLSGSILLVAYLLFCTSVLYETNTSLVLLLSIGIAEILLLPLLGLLAFEHQALGRIARSQLLLILPLALRLAATMAIVLWSPEDPLLAFGYIYCLTAVIALIVAFSTIATPWPRPFTWRLPSKAQWQQTKGYGVLAITAAGPTELDKMLAIKLLSPTASGLYAAGARVISAATLPVIAMMQSALPRLFRESQDQPEHTARLLRWIFSITLAYSLVLATVLWFAAPVFAWLFGERYDGIENMIHWLCLAVPGMALRIAAGSALMAIGRPWMRAGFEMVGLASLLIAAITLTHYFGIVGMPLALACSEWIMAILGSWLLVRAHQKTAKAVV